MDFLNKHPFLLHLANRVVYENPSWLRAKINAAPGLLCKEGVYLCVCWVVGAGDKVRAPGARCQQETRKASMWRGGGSWARGAQSQGVLGVGERDPPPFALACVCP